MISIFIIIISIVVFALMYLIIGVTLWVLTAPYDYIIHTDTTKDPDDVKLLLCRIIFWPKYIRKYYE